MRIKDISSENRPRERLKSYGIDVLSDAELLAVILQSGFVGENVVDLSNRIISRFGIHNINGLGINELTGIRGVGDAKACKVLAAFELAKRVNGGKICERVVKDASDVANYYVEKLRDKKKEYFIAVYLDSKNAVIKDEVVSVGTLNSSLIHPREIFKSAVKESANSLILVHNHPSGSYLPSPEDLEVTTRLVKIGKLMNIEVLDHVIVGKEGYWSFNDKKLPDKLNNGAGF